MATSQRRKGSYHENKILEWLQEIGFKAKKQPLSGQLGGECRGDILIDIGEDQLVVEVKYRDKGSFPSPFSVLEDRDLAIYRRKTGTPKSVLIIDTEVFEEHFVPLLLAGRGKQPRAKRQKVPVYWIPTEELMDSINQTLKEKINHGDETARFCNYHVGKGSTFSDIGLAYRKWCANSVKFRKENESSARLLKVNDPHQVDKSLVSSLESLTGYPVIETAECYTNHMEQISISRILNQVDDEATCDKAIEAVQSSLVPMPIDDIKKQLVILSTLVVKPSGESAGDMSVRSMQYQIS